MHFSFPRFRKLNARRAAKCFRTSAKREFVLQIVLFFNFGMKQSRTLCCADGDEWLICLRPADLYNAHLKRYGNRNTHRKHYFLSIICKSFPNGRLGKVSEKSFARDWLWIKQRNISLMKNDTLIDNKSVAYTKQWQVKLEYHCSIRATFATNFCRKSRLYPMLTSQVQINSKHSGKLHAQASVKSFREQILRP